MKPLCIAGVMSGTSADGLDVALMSIAEDWHWRLLGFHHTLYRPRLRARILAVAAGQGNAAEIAMLHVEHGRATAAAVRAACRRSRVPLARFDAIASHGQTVFHRGRVASLQLGDAATIAAATGMAVINNFRAADIAQGGEGAPLVPWADWRLFGDPHRYRILLNLGGIANLTFLPPGTTPRAVRGFDTGPANMHLDAWMTQISHGRQPMDRNGALAARGQIVPKLLAELLRHPYFRRLPPKSCGREQFGAVWVASLRERWPGLVPADFMATLVALTARTAAAGLRQAGPRARAAEVLVAGGGVHNRTLMASLAAAAPDHSFHRTDTYGVPTQAREAMAFALLAAAHLRHTPANLPAVTSARRPVILGSLTPAPPGPAGA